MNIKVTLSYFTGILLATMLLVSCGDDPTSNTTTPPDVTAPSSQNIVVGESVDLTFNITIDGGYASADITATNGNATISSEPDAGATTGDVVVNYTGNTAGAGSVELTVTDNDGLNGNATAVISVNENPNTVRVTDNIGSDTVWEDGITYILGGRITVLAGATLTIEGGAVIKGEAGSGSNSTALLVARGATLNANGSATAPIIFTSVADEITPEDVDAGNFGSPNLDPTVQGLWGGVIVLGNAPISAQNENGDDVSELQIEGIPSSDTNGLYGGNDPDDSSGTITYISIRHGGTNIGSGNEINGLTLGGVGTGTTIDHVEVVANQDDGVEFFGGSVGGGSVSVSNVLVWNNGDDAIDTDQAWSGTIENMVIISPGDSPFELDGPEGTFTSTGHTIQNGSVYVMGNNAEEMIDVDANTDVNMSNILFFGLTAGNTISSDYPDYEANTNGYAITSLEAVIPSGSTVADFFPGLESETTEVADIPSATVGADASVFGWTWASQSGTLASIGLE